MLEDPRSRLGHLGRYLLLAGQFFRYLLRPPFEHRLLLDQLDHLGVKSLSIAGITALFTGMVLAVQTAYSLEAFGAKLFIAEIVSLSLVRELGPVLTSLMVGGRVGAGITAEIGSMNVTEQVDALRAMAASPVRKLMMPKVLATIIMLPILTAFADLLGILGGLLITVFELRMSASFYINHVIQALTLRDVFSGLGKTVFFGFVIASVGTYNGLQTKGGADGVGRSTTTTVVVASISILVLDFFLTKLFLAL